MSWGATRSCAARTAACASVAPPARNSRPRLGGRRGRRAGVVAQEHHALELRQRLRRQPGPGSRVPRNSPTVTSRRAPLRRRMKPASLPFRRVLSGTSTAPTPRAPSAQTTHSARIGRPDARRGRPAVMPAVDEGGAGASACASSSRKLSCCATLDDRRRIAEALVRREPTHAGSVAGHVGVHTFENSKPHRTMRPMLQAHG